MEPKDFRLCDCGSALPVGANFCPDCGTPSVGMHAVGSHNEGAVNAGRDVHAGRDINITSRMGLPGRIEIPHDRDASRRILPPDVLSLISGLTTVGTLLLSTRLPSVPALLVGLVGLASLVIAVHLQAAKGHLLAEGFHVLPMGLGVLERGTGTGTWLTEPVSVCPFCPEHRASRMTVGGATDAPLWICSLSPKHQLEFDITQLPDLSNTA